MLTFQTDIDEDTGQEVLTCFLLPQLENNAGGLQGNKYIHLINKNKSPLNSITFNLA